MKQRRYFAYYLVPKPGCNSEDSVSYTHLDVYKRQEHWVPVAIVVMAMVASTVLEMSPAVLLRRIIDTALPERDLSLLARLSLGFVGVAIPVSYTHLVVNPAANTAEDTPIYGLSLIHI